jgi:hypothetical protein
LIHHAESREIQAMACVAKGVPLSMRITWGKPCSWKSRLSPKRPPGTASVVAPLAILTSLFVKVALLFFFVASPLIGGEISLLIAIFVSVIARRTGIAARLVAAKERRKQQRCERQDGEHHRAFLTIHHRGPPERRMQRL